MFMFCSAVRLELNNLSKSIAGLLSHRLCDVVSELRERRASQEQKVDYTCHESCDEVSRENGILAFFVPLEKTAAQFGGSGAAALEETDGKGHHRCVSFWFTSEECSQCPAQLSVACSEGLGMKLMK